MNPLVSKVFIKKISALRVNAGMCATSQAHRAVHLLALVHLHILLQLILQAQNIS